jgi:hypothetical protein
MMFFFLNVSCVKQNPSIDVDWEKIWKSNSAIDELKKFQSNHGLFLETINKKEKYSYLAEEGPCGELYVSLVKDTKELPEIIYEINSSGETLASWNSGSGEVDKIEGSRLFRRVFFYEKLEDFMVGAPATSKKHEFTLAMDPTGSFELHVRQGEKTNFQEMKCPSLSKKIKSDYSYCVQDPQSNRMFVFQRPCT